MARTAGKSPLARAALAALVAAGCGGGGGGNGDGDGERADARPDAFDRQAMMAHLASEVFYPTYVAFEARAGELETAATAWCDALGTAGEADALEGARDAWRAAMVEWQHAEMMLVGPASMTEGALRDAVYSWDSVSTCAVDQEVNKVHTDPGGFAISTLPNRRGLDALEYVLFTASLDHTCPSQAAPAGWNDVPDEERRAARCGYAALAAADVAVSAGAIERGWSPDGGNYLAELSAGSGSSLTPQQAANLLSSAMILSLDQMTKDMKLADPAGISDSSLCALGEPCPAELESPHARHGRQNVIANLTGFRMVFTGDREEGAGGPGFDDFLRGLGAAELAEQMEGNIDAAIAATEAVPDPLEEAITGDREAVVAAHAAVKAVTDDLKSQFLTVLGLDPPSGGESDND